MSYKATFVFPTFESRAEFLGWLSDGGGERSFYDTCEIREVPRLMFDGYDSDNVDDEITIEAEILEDEESGS